MVLNVYPGYVASDVHSEYKEPGQVYSFDKIHSSLYDFFNACLLLQFHQHIIATWNNDLFGWIP